MNGEQLSKAWTAIGVFLIVFSTDAWLKTQGAQPLFGSSMPSEYRPSTALLAFFVCSIAAGVLLKISFAYSGKVTTKGFADSLPIAFFKELDLSDSDAVLYQKVMYFFFHIFPLLACVHFLRIVLDTEYVYSDGCRHGEMVSHGPWCWPSGGYQLDNGYRLEHCDGATFFPVLEPTLMSAMLMALIGLNFYYVFFVIKRCSR